MPWHPPSVVALALVTIVGLSPCSAVAQSEFLQPKKSIEEIISHFRAEMDALVEKAGGEARVTLALAFQLCDGLINSLSVAYGDALGKTFDQIDQQQQKFFQQTDKSLEELRKQVEGPVGEALYIAKTANATIADVAFWSQKPMITRVWPQYIGPANMQDTVEVVINGVRLHAADVPAPVLQIGGRAFGGVVTDVDLKFSVPRNAFEILPQKTKLQSGTISLFRKSGSWNPFAPAFDKVDFGVMFTVLPEKLATFRTHATVYEDRIERRNKVTKPPVDTGLQPGWGPHRVPECVKPDQDFKFDLDTISLKVDAFEGRKHKNTSPSINIGGMSIKDGIKLDSVICFEAVARTGCNECWSRTSGHLEVSMTRKYREQQDRKPTDPVEILWSKQSSVSYIPNAVSQLIEIDFFGEYTKLMPLNSSESFGFIKFEANSANRLMLIQPQHVWAPR